MIRQVTVVIPTLNEQESIETVLVGIRRALDPSGWPYEVLVVDGGSRDSTVALAQAAGARVIHEARRGYGRACAAGAAGAMGDTLVFLDADGADDPENLPRLLAPIDRGEADLVLGSRLAGKMQAGAMPWHQRAGNRLAAFLFRRLYGLQVTDLSPLRAVRREMLARLTMHEMTYGWPVEMMARAARAGWRIVEIPTGYRGRMGGKSKISGTVRGTVLATWYILKVIFRYARRGVA